MKLTGVRSVLVIASSRLSLSSAVDQNSTRTELYIIPVARPLLAPGEWSRTSRADFGRQSEFSWAMQAERLRSSVGRFCVVKKLHRMGRYRYEQRHLIYQVR